MALLPNFPLKNQNADTHEINAAFDCVPTALASCLQYELGRSFDGAVIKDAVYGAGYQGGTAASQYVAYCKAQGADLRAINGTPAALIGSIKTQLEAGKPLLITEPDPYAKPSLGWSHVVAMCGYDEPPGTLTAMDPFVARLITLPVNEWQARLEFNQVWLVERIDDMAITIGSPNVGIFFEETDPQHWKCKGNGLVIHDGMLSFYKANNGLLLFGLPLSNEVTLNAQGDTKQYFERACLVWNPSHSLDNPPGSGSVYTAHVYDNGALGEDPLIPKLEATIAQLQSQPATDTVNAKKVADIKVIVNS